RDEKGLITSGSAGLMAFRDLGFFEIDFETANPLDAQIGILAELENIKKYGLSKERLARAKALIAQNHYHEIETLAGMAQDIAYYEALGDWKKSLSYFGSIQKVSADDIARVAKKYLTFENLSAFEYLPESVTRMLNERDYQQAVLAKVAAATEQRTVQELPVAAEIFPSNESITHDFVKP